MGCEVEGLRLVQSGCFRRSGQFAASKGCCYVTSSGGSSVSSKKLGKFCPPADPYSYMIAMVGKCAASVHALCRLYGHGLTLGPSKEDFGNNSDSE